MATITNPIWLDTYADLGQVSSIPFRIKDPNGTVIYQGLSVLRPDETDCTARLNDIAADYLSHTIPGLATSAFTSLTFPVTFTVETYSGGSWSSLSDDYAFLYDWSYDPSYDVTLDGMAFPITGEVSPYQFVLFTAYNVASITATFNYADGTTATQTISLTISDDFNADFNSDFARSVRSAGSGTACFRVASYEKVGTTIESITINGVDYKVVRDCDHQYVLYYLNAHGGWDSLLVTGRSLRTDGLTRYTNEMSYDNSDTKNRGRKDYAIEVARNYAFNTQVMTDDESSLMWHLLESPDVYLHDLVDDVVRPVVLTDSNCTFKQYLPNGARLSQYTIGATIAQNFERR